MQIHLLHFSSRRRTPLILQTEAAECGLACLAMVAGYHGYETDLGSLRQRFSISLKGATLKHLMQIANALNMAPRPLKLDLAHLDQLKLPAIIHWDFNHFVLLTKVGNGRVVIHDPAQGERKLTLEEFSPHFTGVALELTPTEDFEHKIEHRSVGFRQLLGRMPGLAGTVTEILILAAVLELLAIIAPLFMQLVVDNAIVSEDRDLVKALGVGFLLLAFVQVAITALRSWILVYLGTHVNLQLVINLFRHLLRLPTSFFEKRHLGDIVSRFDSLNTIQRTLTSSFLEAVLDGVMAFVTLGMMLLYSWKLALIVCIAASLYALLRLALYAPYRAASEEYIVRAAKQQTHFLETIRGIQSVKLFNRQLFRRATWQNMLIDTFNASIRSQRLTIIYQAINGLLFGIENIVVIWIGALDVLNGGFSIGMLFAFVSYKLQFISRTGSLIDKAIEYGMLSLHRDRVADIALATPESDAQGAQFDSSKLESSIELTNVSFQYSDNEAPVLEGLNLKIEAGEFVAIVGPSGCGKTTLIKIMLGLLEPTSGEVRIGGVPLRKIGHEAYRSIIGAVMQEDQLFAGSIVENISFFDHEVDLPRVAACAALAAIHDDIAAMPMNYQTLVGDMGTVLSGGQKQRVLLARALYRQPKFLFLDEATSHLDVARERAVNEAIQQIPLTRIIIAHRPEMIAMASRIIDLGGAA
jgi:ATP-binding cassette subfamily B protein RaxB